MNEFSALQTIPLRYSCRKYDPVLIPVDLKQKLQKSFETPMNPPFDSNIRINLVAAEDQDQKALRGLGTYGFIRNPAGFIVGTVIDSPNVMVDFGYVLEGIVLVAAQIGLGTCWLGGTFTKSTFAKKVKKNKEEIIPAVIACGIPAKNNRESDIMRRSIRADHRLPWSELFFEKDQQTPLSKESAGVYQDALNMVRLAPSASNKQPWRVIKDEKKWHFICKRTPGYGKNNPLLNLVGLADMQRIDLGIAMAHFELSAKELGLYGRWYVENFNLVDEFPGSEYILTWIED